LFEIFCRVDKKTHSSASSGSRVKPLAILATVDLRPKPVDTLPTASVTAESEATVGDDMSNPAPVSLTNSQ